MINNLSRFVYPPHCLHCSKLTSSHTLVCPECAPFFELILPTNRCRYCFSEKESKGACVECRKNKRWVMPVAACFEKRGAVASVHQALQQGRFPYIAKSLAGFLALQLEQLSWPAPDCIVPLKAPFHRALFGKNPSRLLAKELSQILKVPLNKKIEDKGVLLISDTLNQRVHAYSENLFTHYPRKIWSLSLCI